MEKAKLFDRLLIPIFITGLFFLGTVLVRNEPAKEDQRLRVSFLDVGQGDSALIKTPRGKYVLIDGGPDKTVLSEIGKLMPPTERNIEAVILSHPHADHVSGLNYVLDRYHVGKIYMTGTNYQSPDYEEFLAKIKQYNIPAEKFYEGRSIYIDEVGLEAFWPRGDTLDLIYSNVNDSSIVLNLGYKENNLLFTGDLSAERQDDMIYSGKLRKTDVIKVPHHGSKTGVSQGLLGIVDPTYAIISVGANNKFGHPSAEILEIFKNRKILRTDILGTITFYSDGKTIAN
jgi:competence protein ComEC